MIDIENLVFNTVYDQLSALFPSANITTGYDEQKATYPTVIVRETNNVPVERMNTDDSAENYARLTYEVEVVSNLEPPHVANARKF